MALKIKISVLDLPYLIENPTYNKFKKLYSLVNFFFDFGFLRIGIHEAKKFTDPRH